jgi:aryl-alcohol dehydrogenase-like predicted oxidoreductase
MKRCCDYNKLVLGTVQMGLDYGINNPSGKIQQKDSFEILSYAYEAGIRFLDTAAGYGESHKVIGSFHKENPDQLFNIITKIPHHLDKVNLSDTIAKYLMELNVNQIDILLFHSFEHYEQNPSIKYLLEKLQAEGAIRKMGVSIYTNEQFKVVMQDESVNVIQLPYNVLDNKSIKGELLNEAKERGKEIHSRSAFLQGLFFKDYNDNNPIVAYLKDSLKKIQALSVEYGITLETLLLNYCLINNNIDKVLIGVDSIEQLNSNLNVFEISLPESLVHTIDAIIINDLDYLNPSLWKTLS